MTTTPSNPIPGTQGAAQLQRMERRWMLALTRGKAAGRVALKIVEDAVYADRLNEVLVLGNEQEALEALLVVRRARLHGVQQGLLASLLRLRPTRKAVIEFSRRLRTEGLKEAQIATEAVLQAHNAGSAQHLDLAGRWLPTSSRHCLAKPGAFQASGVNAWTTLGPGRTGGTRGCLLQHLPEVFQ